MHFDLIIVGGGMVGASLAASLRDTSLQIALIDARTPSLDDPRLFALNIGSCDLLKNLQIWPELAEHAAAIHEVHVSHQGRFGAVRLKREEVSLPALGYVIPAKFIEAALNDIVHSASNIKLFQPAKLNLLTQVAGVVSLIIATTEGELTLTTDMVIGADGTESTVRNQLNIETTTHDYGQSVIVTRTTLNRPHQQIAYERFTRDGAIAMLPLVENQCATIWSADNNKIAQLLELSNEEFLQHLQHEFGYRLGRLHSVGERFCYPLRMMRAETMTQGAVMLLGNSAHTLHPIAAQGFNLALYEVATLVEAIDEQLKQQT